MGKVGFVGGRGEVEGEWGGGKGGKEGGWVSKSLSDHYNAQRECMCNCVRSSPMQKICLTNDLQLLSLL